MGVAECHVTDATLTSTPKKAHLWERDEHDYYVEPFWCSERLFKLERFEGSVWDPACGSGRIVESAIAAGLDAVGSDIVDRWPDADIDKHVTGSFFDVHQPLGRNIVCNPPFKLAKEFVEIALLVAADKVAMLLPTTWMNSDKRGRWLETTPLLRVLLLTPRPSMPPGRVIEAGEEPGNGTKDFAWFIWRRGYRGMPHLGWLRRDP